MMRDLFDKCIQSSYMVCIFRWMGFPYVVQWYNAEVRSLRKLILLCWVMLSTWWNELCSLTSSFHEYRSDGSVTRPDLSTTACSLMNEGPRDNRIFAFWILYCSVPMTANPTSQLPDQFATQRHVCSRKKDLMVTYHFLSGLSDIQIRQMSYRRLSCQTSAQCKGMFAHGKKTDWCHRSLMETGPTDYIAFLFWAFCRLAPTNATPTAYLPDQFAIQRHVRSWKEVQMVT